MSQLSSCLPDTDSGVYSSVSVNSVRDSKNRYTNVRRQNKGGTGILDRSLIYKQFIPNMKQQITGPENFKKGNQSKPELSRYFSDSWKISQEASWRHLILSTLPRKYSMDDMLVQKRTISTADNLEDRQEEDLCQKFEKIYEQNKNMNLNRRLSSYFSSLPRISPVRSWPWLSGHRS